MEVERDENHPLKRRLKRILDLRLGESEDLINGLLALDSNDEITSEFLRELLEDKNHNLCRSLQFSTYKHQILAAEKFVESLKPIIDDLKALNSGFRNSGELFNDSLINELNCWSKYTLPLVEDFKRIENEIDVVETKRNMCNALLTGLSASFVNDIKGMRSSMTSTQDFLRSIVAIYKKCLISESNSRKLISMFEANSCSEIDKAKDVDAAVKDNNFKSSILELCNDSEYSNMIPNIVMNLRALVLDLECKRNQIAEEITSTLVEKLNNYSPSEFFDQLEEIFENKSFLDSVDLLMRHHKDSYSSLLFNIMKSRSNYLEYRFNNIISQGINISNIGSDINNNHLSNILDYLYSLFEWISVCGVSVESEFLTKALYYEHNDNCVFEQAVNGQQFGGNILVIFKNIKDVDKLEYFSRNFLNIVTSVLCIPFSGSIRDILRQFHPPQTSRPDSIHHFGNLTALKTGITIGIKIAHLIDNYINKITPMFKILPKFSINDSDDNYTLSTPLLIQKFRDLKEEAIAQYFVYAELVKENILRRIDDITTKDMSISLLVMEWSNLLRDILYTMENDYIDASDNMTEGEASFHSNENDINSTLSSMLDSFINPMLNLICGISVSPKRIPLTCIIKINNLGYLCNNMELHSKMTKYIDKHIRIIKKVVDDEKAQLIEFVIDEFNIRYRFKELLRELSSKDGAQTSISTEEFISGSNHHYAENNIENEEQESLIKLSQVILGQFFDTILRFGTVPFPNIERIQDKTTRKEILTHIHMYIVTQYISIYDKLNAISRTKRHLLKYNGGEIKAIFDGVVNKI